MLHGLKAQSRRLFDTIHLYYYEALLPTHCDETQSFERARGFEMIDLCRPPQAKMKFTANKRSTQLNYCWFERFALLFRPNSYPLNRSLLLFLLQRKYRYVNIHSLLFCFNNPSIKANVVISFFQDGILFVRRSFFRPFVRTEKRKYHDTTELRIFNFQIKIISKFSIIRSSFYRSHEHYTPNYFCQWILEAQIWTSKENYGGRADLFSRIFVATMITATQLRYDLTKRRHATKVHRGNTQFPFYMNYIPPFLLPPPPSPSPLMDLMPAVEA